MKFGKHSNLVVGLNATVLTRPVTGVAKRLLALFEAMQKIEPMLEPVLFSNRVVPAALLPNAKRVLFSLPIGSLWVNRVLPHQLQQHGICLFDSQWGGGLPLARSRKSVPYVTTYHDMLPLDDGHTSLYKQKVFRWRVERNLDVADRVVVVSRHTGERLLHYFPQAEGKLVLSYNGVASSFRNYTAQELRQAEDLLLKKYDIKQKFLFYVGGFSRRKNVERLLTVFSLLVAKGYAGQLVLAGTKNSYFKRSIWPVVVALGLQSRVRPLGYVEEQFLPPLYNVADCLLYPSLGEGFGMPPLEAMACGTPAVVDRSSPLAEIDEGSALFVDCESEKDFLQAIENVLSKNRRNLARLQSGLDLAASYSWDCIALEYLKMYEQLLASV